MTIPKRQRREPPERTAPIRNKFAAPPRVDGQRHAAFSASTVAGETAKRVKSSFKSADEAMRRTVERGVDTAYKVIDEYMLHGRQAAGRHHGRRGAQGSDATGDGQQAWNNYSAAWKALTPLAAPLIQILRQLAGGAAASGAGIASDWLNQLMPGQQRNGSNTVVAVQVSSRAQTEVTVDLQPGADSQNLKADPLVHTERRDAPPLVSIALESRAGQIRVRVTVPNDQPAGTYVGALHDVTGVKRGELRVAIAAAPWRAAQATAKKKANGSGVR